MKFFLILIFIFFSTNSFADNNSPIENKIFKNLRCLICQGQSIPSLNKTNFLLWMIPYLIFLAGGCVIFFIFRKSKHN